MRTASAPMSEHMAGFLAAKKLAPKSKQDYGRYLREFDEYTEHPSLRTGLTLDNAARWVAEVSERGPAAGHNACMALKSFASWIAKSRVIPGGSVLVGLEAPRVPKSSRTAFTDQQLALIARCIENRPTSDRRRAKAYVWLLYAAGLRKNEARQLALEDVHLDMTGNRSWVHVRAATSKGYKERRVRLDQSAVPAIAAYIGTRPTYVPPTDDPTAPERLFLTVDGTGFSEYGFATWVGRIFEDIRRETGIKASSHWFRHTWATQFHRASKFTGLTVYDLMREGGWADPNIPLTYTHERPWEELLEMPTHLTELAKHRKVG